MKEEVWLPVQGYEGLYEVSSLGRVKSLPGGRRKGDCLKLAIRDGYYACSLHKDRVSKSFPAHRLVAKAFIDNPINLETVNHMNGNKLDNRVENLEWMSRRDNTIHAYKVLGVRKPNYETCSNGHPREGNTNYQTVRGESIGMVCKICANKRRRDNRKLRDSIDSSTRQRSDSDTRDYTKWYIAIRNIDSGKIYESVSAAARETGIKRTGILNNIAGLSKSAGGFRWERVN